MATLADREQGVAAFWNRYRGALVKRGVQGKAADWTVKRAQHFVAALPAVRLANRTPEDLRAYFARTLARPVWKEWQVAQVVTAVHVLYADLVQTPWAGEFPWQAWKEPHLHFPEVLARYGPGGDSRHAKVPRRPVADSPQGLAAVDAHGEVFERLRAELRTRHYSLKTERSYSDWLQRLVTFCGGQLPREDAEGAVRTYLTFLANDRRVSASTQNQALCALLFAYREALGRPLALIGEFGKAKRPRHLPTVLSRDEADRVLGRMEGTSRTLAGLLYGAGLRVSECLALRVKDVDFDRHQIVVRDGKGEKDRVTVLPESSRGPLEEHLVRVRELFEADRKAGLPGVFIWPALERPLSPGPWAPRHSPLPGQRKNTPRQAPSGSGSGSSRRPTCRRTRGAASSDDTTSTSP